jgi:hypothetical protein
MVLTADRIPGTPRYLGDIHEYPMATATHLYAGQAVGLDTAGNAVAMSLTTGLIAVGCCEEEVNNTGAAAALKVKVREGVFRWDNYGTITKASIGDVVYAYNDVSVQASSSSASAMGIMVDIDSLGVWVKMPPMTISTLGLLAANNLSDVGTAATAATNLGLGTANSPTFADVTTTDDIDVGDDLRVVGLVTIGETLKVTGNLTAKGLLSVETATKTVGTAADEGGIVIQDLTDNAVITLPNIAAGNKGMQVTVQNTGADGAAKISISPDASDKIVGTVGAVQSGGVADKDWINTKATANQGDYTTLVSDGTDTWWIIGGVGVWASE